MKDSLYNRLWRRECGEQSQYAGLRGIYGSKEWIDDLDIVNELGGHTGCVNALRYATQDFGSIDCSTHHLGRANHLAVGRDQDVFWRQVRMISTSISIPTNLNPQMLNLH